MLNINNIPTSQKRVLVFTAQTPKVSNKQVYFLCSQHQMEDILMDTAVQPVPLSPSFVEGLAEWRNQVLPVISLEACLGFESLKATKVQRLMVVRAAKNDVTTTELHRIMLRVVPPIRMLTLPIECFSASDEWIPDKNYARAVYEWKDGLLVVAHMGDILCGRD
jgi:chemotaxis signal transduction protein